MNDSKADQQSEDRSENVLAIAPVLRAKVRGMKSIGPGPKLLFDTLTDLIFIRRYSLSPGVVKIGMPRLAEMLGCSECTVDRWAEELRQNQRIWTKVIYEARSKMTAWYVRDIADSQQEFFDRASHSFGPARLKCPAPARGANGKFASPQNCNNGKTRGNGASISDLPTLTPQKCGYHPRNSAETIAAELTVLNRQNGGHHNGNSAEIISAEMTVQSPQNSPNHNGKHAETITADAPGYKDIHTVNGRDTGYSFKRSTGFNALQRAEKITAENTFLKDVAEVMDLWKPGHSEFELTNSGAWWRQCYRVNRNLILRVLADTRGGIKENKILTTPGQYAVDLWKRWNLDLIKDKQKTGERTPARA